MTTRSDHHATMRQHVYVVDRFPSYSETFVATEIKSLRAKGAAVRVYSIHRPTAAFKGAAPYVVPPASVLRLLPWTIPGLVLLISNYWNRGLRFNLRSLPKLLFAASHAARLSKCLRHVDRSDKTQLVLHAHFLARPADVVGLASVRLPNAPVLVTSHAGDAKDRRDPILRHWRISKADHVLAASRFVLDNLANEPRQASIVHCGIETAKLPPVGRHIGDKGIRVVTVARLIPTKGYDRAISIIQALNSIYPEPLTWHVVGDGPMREEIEIASRNLCNAGVEVVLHGAVDHSKTLEIIGRSDVFLLPSRPTMLHENAGDGIPVAILEGMALGKLVVATAAGGIPEAVIDGQTGLLITSESDQEVAERILNTVTNSDVYEDIAVGAAAKIEDEFEASKSADRIEQIVTSLLQARKDRARSTEAGTT